MSDSITTSVEVAAPPEVAFDVFTREIDAWYQIDTDTLPDITRTAAIRFEPCLGGRLLDVHDVATGAGRELGRITAWDPGRGLAFHDNEGTEIDVSFEPCAAGTRVTLTHRGLDRLAPKRSAQLRRSGWGALAPFYRDHLAPNTRPLAVAVAFSALAFLAVWGGLWLAGTPPLDQLPDWAGMSLTMALVLAACVAVVEMQDRLVPRRLRSEWLRSEWQYERIVVRLLGLLGLGLFINGLYNIIKHGDDALGAVGVPALLLLSYWMMEEQGPARGRSLRKRAGSAENPSAQRLPRVRRSLARLRRRKWGLLVICFPLVFVPVSVLGSIDALEGAALPATLATILSLYVVVSKRRERRALGFDPDLCLAVARAVSEAGRPPELLVHHDQPSGQPEYSGWYAYANEQDEGSDDLVAWSMKDLVDHSPEATHVLREGHGKWRWDQAQRAYQRIENLSENPQPA